MEGDLITGKCSNILMMLMMMMRLVAEEDDETINVLVLLPLVGGDVEV